MRPSRAAGLRSESSARFERGVTEALTLRAADRAVALIQELCGASVEGRWCAGGAAVDQAPVVLRRLALDRLLGPIQDSEGQESVIADDVVAEILQRLGCRVEADLDSDGQVECWQVVVPPSRSHDLLREVDLIEEIGLEIGHDFLQAPGQLTFLNNHLVYHGRTAWKFDEADDASSRDDVDNGRLLLRAWVSPYNSRPLPDTPEFNEMWGDVRPGVPRGGLEPAVKAGIKAKPPELIEAYTSGKADYYGLYKRSWSQDEDVTFGAAPKAA